MRGVNGGQSTENNERTGLDCAAWAVEAGRYDTDRERIGEDLNQTCSVTRITIEGYTLVIGMIEGGDR